MNFYTTDERKDFESNIEKLFDSIDKYIKWDIQEVKWIILYLYMTLQSLFIIKLRFTNNAFLEKWTSKVGEYIFYICYDSEKTYLKNRICNLDYIKENKIGIDVFKINDVDSIKAELEKNKFFIKKENIEKAIKNCSELITFNNMFNKMCDEDISNSLQFHKLNKNNYFRTIKFLINSRNDFIHFMPKSRSIGLNLFHEITNNWLNIIDSLLAMKTQNDINKNKDIKEKIKKTKKYFQTC